MLSALFSMLCDLLFGLSDHEHSTLASLPDFHLVRMQHSTAKLAIPVRDSPFVFLPQFPHNESFQIWQAPSRGRLPEIYENLLPVLSAHRRLGPYCLYIDYFRFTIDDCKNQLGAGKPLPLAGLNFRGLAFRVAGTINFSMITLGCYPSPHSPSFKTLDSFYDSVVLYLAHSCLCVLYGYREPRCIGEVLKKPRPNSGCE